MTPCLDLFSDGSETTAPPLPMQEAKPKGVARVQKPNRTQLELRPSDLESLLPEGHRARMVWGYVERQDMTGPVRGDQGRRRRRWARRDCPGDPVRPVAVCHP